MKANPSTLAQVNCKVRKWYKWVCVESLPPRVDKSQRLSCSLNARRPEERGMKPLLSVWRLFRGDNENPTQAVLAVPAAAAADAFLTFWPFRFSIFILINISLGFFCFLFFSAMKGSGSSTVRDGGLKGRENSFLKVSIKFPLSRAEWRAGRAGLGGGQVDSAGMS